MQLLETLYDNFIAILKYNLKKSKKIGEDLLPDIWISERNKRQKINNDNKSYLAENWPAINMHVEESKYFFFTLHYY